MRPEARPPSTISQPPGWEMKRAYWRNLLMSDLILLIVGGAAIGLASILHEHVPSGKRAVRIEREIRAEADTLEIWTANGSYELTRYGSPRTGAMVWGTKRPIVVRDIPPSLVSSHRAEVDSRLSEKESSHERGNTIFAASGPYLGRISGVPDGQVYRPNGNGAFLDLQPIGRRHPRGIGGAPLLPGDVVRKPVVDVRAIGSPELDKFHDTSWVVVDMLIGPDTLDIIVLEEYPPFKGYGDEAIKGLLVGKHSPTLVNGQPRLTQIILTIYFCLDCKPVNLAVQSIDVKY